MVLEIKSKHTLVDLAEGALWVLARGEISGGLKTERRCRNNGRSNYEAIIRVWCSLWTSN